MEQIQFRSTRAHPTPSPGGEGDVYVPPTWFGRLKENLRTGGRDPIFRRTMLISLFIHFMIIFGIPFLIGLFTFVEDYRVPKGSGVADPAGMAAAAPPRPQVIQAKMRAKKVRKKFVLRTNSAILFHVPDITESKAFKETQEMSELTYKTEGTSAQELVAMATGSGGDRETAGGIVKGGTGKSRGRLGKGGGLEGGWPEGSENAIVRFIRLNHGGPNWDDGMQANRASDVNLLKKFGEATGFKVRGYSESHPIRQLKEYRAGFAPPFVYITGTGAINASPADIKILRDYILSGGMLFADCGSPQFDGAFRGLMQSLFPDKPLVTIADDDRIFQEPNILPNGAPPLYHHGGWKAMGVKHQDRWAVFYHPGDLKDAFRVGSSGMSANTVREAHELGINIIYYAFSHYLEATKQERK